MDERGRWEIVRCPSEVVRFPFSPDSPSVSLFTRLKLSHFSLQLGDLIFELLQFRRVVGLGT